MNDGQAKEEWMSVSYEMTCKSPGNPQLILPLRMKTIRSVNGYERKQ